MKVLTIGRSPENNIVINDTRVSRIHLQIVQDDNGNYSVVDLNSANGTFVNGQRIMGEFYLQATDTVKIGDTVLPWQSYFPPNRIDQDSDSESDRKPKPKSIIWYIVAAVVLLLLLAGGGVYWKISHDKKVVIEQMEKENEEKEKAKKIEDEANEAEKKAMKKEIEIEEQARKEAQEKALKAEEKRIQEAKDAEKKAKEEAQKVAKEKKETEQKAEKEKAAAEQKAKDKAEFDQLKIIVESMKGMGVIPDEKIAEMKKIAKKYPDDPYFQKIIKSIEN